MRERLRLCVGLFFMVVDPTVLTLKSDEEPDHQLGKLSDTVKSRRFLHG